MLPIRLRDFVEDPDGWIYAVSTYDNEINVGCVLRYVPDDEGERVGPSGQRYRKYDFEEAYARIAREKPAYAGLVQRIPRADLRRVLKPDLEIPRIAASHPRVKKLLDLFQLPPGTVGCTGSLLCGLENGSSDIDMVVYGKHWFTAQALVRQGIADGRIEGMSPEMWRKVYRSASLRSPMMSLYSMSSGNGTGGRLRAPISISSTRDPTITSQVLPAGEERFSGSRRSWQR